MNDEVLEINRAAREMRAKLDPLYAEISRLIYGQRSLVDRLIIGLLTGGHILIEGVPGLAKTLAARTLAASIRAEFHRIQFTPDLLPADVIGTQIYDVRNGTFSVRRGPVFANLILADEINRAPAKVQSALLEAMQEHQVSIGEETFSLPKPFMVLATQNPIEHEGTYPLPEAQMDRFMLKLKMGYPAKDEEFNIINRMATVEPDLAVNPVMETEEIMALRRAVDAIYIDDKVKWYIVELVDTLRHPDAHGLNVGPFVQFGPSPRGTIYLTLASKAHALLSSRGYVTPDDVKAMAHEVLAHRIIVTYEAEAEEMTAEAILKTVLDSVDVP